MIKPWLFGIVFAALAASGAYAQDKKEPTPQQMRMSECNQQAGTKGLKGDERKGFMSECLKAKKAATQQEKMARCNSDASAQSLKGDERKKFMSNCLKG